MRILFVVLDNMSYISSFPSGTAYLVAVLEKHGFHVDIYQQDIHHYPKEHLKSFLDANERYDFIGLSFISGYWQYKKALEISSAIHESRHQSFYCLGGHGPAPEPEFFLKKLRADAICIGEGEETILEMLDAVANKRSLAAVKGLAWRDGDVVHVNERRPLIRDLDALPFPAYHRFPMEVYRLIRGPRTTNADFSMSMLSGRGCPFKCNFCYRLDSGFRTRGNESIIEEIRLLSKDYGIRCINFDDELLVSSEERAISLCEDFLKNDLKIMWTCNGRLNYAKPAVLDVMRRSGCVFINYGIEAMDDQILKNMHKNLSTKQIIAGVEATLKAGISPGLNIIFGNIGENRETLMKGVEFLLQYDDGTQKRTIRPVTPYPGTELYRIGIERGLIKDCEDFYENLHLNSDLMAVNFTDLSDEEYYTALMEANAILLDAYNKRMVEQTQKLLHDLYVKKDASFRGFRQI